MFRQYPGNTCHEASNTLPNGPLLDDQIPHDRRLLLFDENLYFLSIDTKFQPEVKAVVLLYLYYRKPVQYNNVAHLRI